MTRFPRVSTNRRFPNDPAVTVPANLEVEIAPGEWAALGTLGTTNYGGPGSAAKAQRYEEVIGRFVRLYLAAPDMLARLDAVARWLRKVPLPANDQDLRDQAARVLVEVEAAIKQAKGKR